MKSKKEKEKRKKKRNNRNAEGSRLRGVEGGEKKPYIKKSSVPRKRGDF